MQDKLAYLNIKIEDTIETIWKRSLFMMVTTSICFSIILLSILGA